MFNKPPLFNKPAETPGARMPSRPLNAPPLSPASSTVVATPRSEAVADSSPAPARPLAEVEDGARASDSRLIVGPEVKLKGAQILDCDTLVVEGRVEATMDSRVIRIAENGAFSGTVGIDVAEIHGRFEGELTARKQLIVHATGRVSGKIRYGKIFIEEGGEISGDVQSLSTVQESSRALERESSVPRVVAAAG